MKTIIIPDIHHKTTLVDYIINQHPNTSVLFLGDYFDDFDDNPWTAHDTAAWLRARLNNPFYRFLWGNHDLPYAYPQVNGLMCGGFEWDKCAAINSVMTEKDWAKLKFSTHIEGWDFTHAGITKGLTLVDDEEITAALMNGDLHPLLQPGKARGGWARKGGIIWCDYDNEFAPNPVYPKQIFGHTSHVEPRCMKHRMVGENWALDTHMKHYAILENGEITICPTFG